MSTGVSQIRGVEDEDGVDGDEVEAQFNPRVMMIRLKASIMILAAMIATSSGGVWWGSTKELDKSGLMSKNCPYSEGSAKTSHRISLGR